MAWTQADIDALDRAIAEAGMTNSVTYNDGTGWQRIPVKDALLLRKTMKDAVETASAQRTTRAVRITPRSGY